MSKSTSPSHANVRERLKRRQAELLSKFDRAAEHELRAIDAACRRVDDAVEAKALDRAMTRAMSATTKLGDALLSIEAQLGRADLALRAVSLGEKAQDTRQVERDKREVIKTAMAEDRRAAAIEMKEAKLDLIRSGGAPAQPPVSPAPSGSAVEAGAGPPREEAA
jgi:hypothetical protein